MLHALLLFKHNLERLGTFVGLDVEKIYAIWMITNVNIKLGWTDTPFLNKLSFNIDKFYLFDYVKFIQFFCRNVNSASGWVWYGCHILLLFDFVNSMNNGDVRD